MRTKNFLRVGACALLLLAAGPVSAQPKEGAARGKKNVAVFVHEPARLCNADLLHRIHQ